MEKEKLIKGLIHDIKNPINSLIGSLELCSEEVEKQKESSIGDFLFPALNSARIINLLLDELSFIMFNPSFYSFDEGELDLVEEFMKIIELYETRRRNKKLNIFFETKTKENSRSLSYYTSSKFLFRSIIRNVFDNATKYTPPQGKIEIFISKNNAGFVIEIKNSFIPDDEPQNRTKLGLVLIKEYVKHIDAKVQIEKNEKEFLVKLRFPFVTPSVWAK